MSLLWIGWDEAGYGPTLGPLVIACAGWKFPQAADRHTAASRLAAVTTTRQPVMQYRAFDGWVAKQESDGKSPHPTTWRRKTPPLWVTDSKQIHQPAQPARLERAALPLLELLLSTTLDATTLKELSWSYGHAPHEWEWPEKLYLPQQINRKQVPPTEFYATQLLENCIIPAGFKARVIFPCEFNRLLDTQGNKSTLLSTAGLQLLVEVLHTQVASDTEMIIVDADKHGGRDRYGELLAAAWPDQVVNTVEETRSQSTYRLEYAGRPCEIRFQTRGDSLPPTATASLGAKYIRELSMEQLNRWFRHRLPSIKPTAGYPVDAVRFLSETATLRQSLSMADHDLIRCK